MKTKVKTVLAACLVMVGMMFSMHGRTAFAYTSEAEQQTTETVVVDAESGTSNNETGAGNAVGVPIAEEQSNTEERSDERETAGRVQGESFSVPGNGQLADDLNSDESKQFLTIQTKNGNTFFMILDRSSNTENVYMLSMIDEDDLAEFIGDSKKESKQPSIVIPETENTSNSSSSLKAEKGPETEEKKDGMSRGALLAIVLLLVGSVGGYYYFKVLKPRKEEDEEDVEDLEFYDGGAYVNEDQEDSDEEEEDE